ncbi:energy-coupling factor transporter transmembrane component T [Zongyangia sp. HA2173]|uniref:energy-coupling factor transporter transmembrane component T n=1 Tax=Zongyangia sp. HA2173 TaxID=3133035 RepID=UPI0031607509
MIGGALFRRGLWLDPRTKILLLLLCILSAMMAPSLFYELGLVVLIGLLGICFGKWKYAWKGVLFYALIVLLTTWIMDTMTGTWRTMFIAFLGLFHKVYPCGMLSGIVISTTKVSEFLSAMNRIHAPQKLVIPLAVMLRYISTIQEDWRFIKDAMRMRDVSPSLKGFLTHPGITVECIYVPLMMAASKAADELSIASITRGIENPKPRTCLVQIHIGLMDIAAVFCFAGALAERGCWDDRVKACIIYLSRTNRRRAA